LESSLTIRLPNVVLVAVVLWVCFFSGLGAFGLVGPDEPRYAFVARDMARASDWVTPRLYGQPWFEKPILYYWAAAAFFRLSSGNERPARLPSSFAALATVWALAWLAWKHYGAAPAWCVSLIFPTSIAAFGFARAATPDMLFSAALTLAMAGAAGVLASSGCFQRSMGEEVHATRADALGRAAFGFWLGMATLAKGPAAVLLAAGSLALCGLATNRWRKLFRLASPLAVTAFLVVALPWYVLCALRNPEFLRTFIWTHNFERYVSPIFMHRQPFWFFGPIVLLGLLPWTALLLGVARDGIKRWHSDSWKYSPGLFFACWAIFPAVFFSFSQSKLPGYVLPSIPPLALLMATSIARAIDSASNSARWLTASIGITWMALALSLSFCFKKLPPPSNTLVSPSASEWGDAMAIVALVLVTLALLRRSHAVLALSSLLVVVLIETANLHFLPQLDPYISARHAAAALAKPSDRTYDVAVLQLHRAWHYGLNFYMDRELPEWTPAASKPTLVYTNGAGLKVLEGSGRPIHLYDQTSPQTILVLVGSQSR
jgi:4-amino-4-deoxy-L-arabinose transferase-like glycosyltransferase